MIQDITLNVQATIDEDQLLAAVLATEDEAIISFVMRLDEALARLEFTESLIKALIKDVSGSMEPEEFADFIAELSGFCP